MDDVIIKRAALDDVGQLCAIGKETFFETFAESNTREDMAQYLQDGFSIEKLTQEIKDPRSEFYFAMLRDKIIGYLKLNMGNAQTELQDPRALEIERIYVLKDYHGKSVGQVLYEKAMTVARESRLDYIWLGVWEENPRAISFYEKNGFVAFDKHIFRLGNEEQTDILMKKPILSEPSGGGPGR